MKKLKTFIIRKTKCYRFAKRNVPESKTKRLRYRPPLCYTKIALGLDKNAILTLFAFMQSNTFFALSFCHLCGETPSDHQFPQL